MRGVCTPKGFLTRGLKGCYVCIEDDATLQNWSEGHARRADYTGARVGEA